MSEDRTAETNGSRNFEERVFARFDALDVRMDRMEERFEQRFKSVDDRLGKLEAKQYDTKPIWERVLAELGAMKEQIASLDRKIESFDRKFEVLSKDMVQLI